MFWPFGKRRVLTFGFAHSIHTWTLRSTDEMASVTFFDKANTGDLSCKFSYRGKMVYVSRFLWNEDKTYV